MSKKKKTNSLEELGGMVYSTNPNQELGGEEENVNTPAPGAQQLEAHLEKKGRAGKSATIIKGFEGSEDDLKELGKALKNHCACGGSVKNGEIVLQGDRQKAMEFLKKQGYKVKRVGG